MTPTSAVPMLTVKRFVAAVLVCTALVSVLGAMRADDANASWPVTSCGWARNAYVPSHSLPRIWRDFHTGCGVLKRPFDVTTPGTIHAARLVGHQWCVAMHLRPRPPLGAVMSWVQATYTCGRGTLLWDYVYVY
jgi:hypothetical protein